MNKKAIVTGGSRGIGAAIVEKLGENGYDVVFNYHTRQDKAEEIVNRLTSKNIKIAAFQADLSSFENAAKFVNLAKEFLGDVDLLVN
ncbi:MAG: SDR family NAD(P)-dependent oxidoreductase, partial [Chitinispirillaceae bacterium]|nr:SDR family NAD(P)-dependent oxidoreductase [Chitinispirillaceae bacterium]